MKTLLIIAFFVVGCSTFASAQQRAVYSNFLMNDFYYNPAIAGSKEIHQANITYRNQWVGFDGAPSLILGNFSGSIKNEGKIGYGVSLVSETAGITQNTGVYLNYAHHFKLSDELKLGLGIQPGYMQYRVKLYDAQLADQGDEVLTGSVYSASAVDVSTGFHLYSDKFFLMGSLHHMLGKSVQFTSYNSNLEFHYTAIGGFNININADPKTKKMPIVIQPSFLVRYVRPVPVQWTAMLKTTFNKKYWAGLIYRSDDAIGVSVGMEIATQFSVGYGFDYTLSGLSSYQAGSHEIMLSYVISRKKPSLAEKDDELNKSILDELKKSIEENKKN
ncbi:MAG: type IX secretion system membrane protein PorP/SprF [Crocinitomicaceae bacterium]|nr:type IX secretion system membrane protein PorP/SprF [Flavobacteriales bacterium]NQZ36692.1 type IX secretion system membrane protein PorP/SprF [Crocinitomicaceae bacterium]